MSNLFSDEIKENEIRVIGADDFGDKSRRPKSRFGCFLIFVILVILIGVFVWGFTTCGEGESSNALADTDSVVEQSYFEPINDVDAMALKVEAPKDTIIAHLGETPPKDVPGYTEIISKTINDIPLNIYIPHNAYAILKVGPSIPFGTNYVFVAQAADIRRDNKDIVGAFVLKGNPLAWTMSKKGFCAIINDSITVGCAESSPLFEKATETDGYFFRQYPLVDNGKLVENEPKNKSIRRALCERGDEIIIVESQTKESFHDFAQALVDLDVTNAIYLVGSSAYGYAVDKNKKCHSFGVMKRRIPAKTSYIVWCRK